MSFFKEQGEQARAAFAAMPIQSRIIMGLLLAAVGVGLAFLVRGEIDTGRVALFGGRSFSEQESAAVEIAFSRAGLNGWKRDGTRVMIPSESKADYLAALEDSATLPMSVRSNLEDALNKASVFDSSEMRKSREMHAREKDLARSIMSFADVRHATVAYDRGERSGLSRQRPQSASVVVQPMGSAPLERTRIRTIQQLVRGAFSGMASDDVVVTDLNGTSSAMLDDDDPMSRKKRETETWLEAKARGLLVGYPARIAVSAEIDPTMDAQTTTLKYDAEPTTLASSQKKVETATSRQPTGGVPGVEPNAIGNRSAKLDDAAETSTSKADQRETRSVAGQQYENSRMASLQVKRVRVTVGLPESFYENLHVRKSMRENPDLKAAADVPPMTPAQLQDFRDETTRNIQSALTPLLPEVSAGEDRATFVNVWDYPDPPEVEPPPSDTAGIAMTWLADSWQTLVLVFMGLMALMVARSAAKAAVSVPAEFQEGFGLELPEAEVSEDDEENSDNMDITGETLQDELAVIINNNPEVAANVIRTWVGEAA